MSLTQRLGQLEKKVTAAGSKASGRGKVIIVRKYTDVPGAALIGYRDGSGHLLPLDRTQWPHVPAGTVKVMSQVWSDDEDAELPHTEVRRNPCGLHNESAN